MSAVVEAPISRTRALMRMSPEERRMRAIAAQRAEDLLRRELLAAEVHRALAGERPTRWAGSRAAAFAARPLKLTDYPERGASGSLALFAEALPDHFGDRRFARTGLRIARIVFADGSSVLECSEVAR